MPVAAGVVGDPPVPAVGAGLDMTAQRSGAAVLDRRHDLELMQAQMPGMGGPVGRAGSAEDVGDLERGPHRLSREAPPVRAGTGRACRADWSPRAPCGCHPGIEGGGLQLGVAEQRLDDADIDAVLEQVRGEAVPQRVRPDPLGDLGRLRGFDDDPVELAGGDRLERSAARGTASHRGASRPVRGPASTTGAAASSRSAGSMALRYCPPLPRSTRSSIRSLSMSRTLSIETSATRSPAP